MSVAEDRFDLARFVAAQEDSWDAAIGELRRGRKTTHWMWFVFPQIAGLGRSDMARRYAIGSLDEARGYLAHPLLGARLRAGCDALLAHPRSSAEEIMGGIDAVKLRSSMTLFAAAADDPALFDAVLARFFTGARDDATLALIRPVSSARA